MTYEEFCAGFQIRLNEQQTEAVRSVEGPVLLLAVPGSGKTTVLITRLGYMIYCAGILPEEILTLTYTVAATHDMAARFRAYFGEELGGRLEFRTINGVCARIIQYYGRLIGKSAFTLLTDEKAVTAMLSGIYQKVEGAYPAGSDIKNIRTLITYIKNSMLTGEEIRKLEEGCGFRIGEMYQNYCGELRSRGLMDYDDQMTYAYAILRKSPETLQYFQNRYPYLCVDEAQDTSKIQHEIIRILAGERDQLFMVGDEDQSIYGFRAAYPEALLRFGQDHPGAKVLLMEENFRSNARIVEAADRFIQKNVLRHEKHMRAARSAGAEIREIDLKGRSVQYRYLVKVAQDCRTQTAVLYRDNESALPLVDLLERQGIPYRIRSAELAFFTHRVVLDIQNIILFAENPGDTDLFLQVYYKLSTYISKENAVRICEISREKKLGVLETAIFHGELQPKARNEESPRRLVERLGELQEIIKEKKNDPKCRFILSTIHASKGLEYDTVYLMDVIDGIFPEGGPEQGKQAGEKGRDSIPGSMRAEADRDLEEYEEERRLFYVGVTRAKERLLIFTVNRKSVFAKELIRGGISALSRQTRERADLRIGAVRAVQGGFRKGREGNAFSGEAFAQFCETLGEGLIVAHKKFGKGVVAEMSENWVIIRFEERERRFELKTFMASIACSAVHFIVSIKFMMEESMALSEPFAMPCSNPCAMPCSNPCAMPSAMAFA